MRKTVFSLSFAILFLLGGCQQDPVDFGYVNFYINPESTEFYHLNTGARGWEYLRGGYRGVIIHRTSSFSFVAFERSCTAKECHERLDVDKTNTMISCPKCHSLYFLFDGSPIQGSKSRRPLFQYCAYYYGETLSVNNCR